MKDNQIDRLFGERLENQKTAPPAHIWDKIEENLPKKSKKAAYIPWVVAASIMLLLSFGYLAISKLPSSPESAPLAEKKAELPASEEPINVPMEENMEASSKVMNTIFAIQPKTRTTLLIQKKQPKQLKVEQVHLQEPKSDEPILHIVAVASPKLSVLKGIVSTHDLRIRPNLLLNAKNYAMSQPKVKKSQKNDGKFSFIRSVASIAKSVDKGAEALSDLREAKNEWVNETLISEDETKDTPNKNPPK